VREHDIELNLEPEEKDSVTVWRKSSGNLVLKVAGRAAHAGVEPQNGRNAAEELINQIRKLDAAFPRSGDGITVNLTLLKAGSRSNIIPAAAEATLNVRGRTREDMEAVQAKAREYAASPTLADTKVSLDFDLSFPPLVQNARVTAVADKAKSVWAELGRDLVYGGNGGASESALADAAGTSALDGLGAPGGGAHTPNEFLELDSLTPRLYLLVRLTETYGAQPPVKTPTK
jgi:glutamate carboxypeptidase